MKPESRLFIGSSFVDSESGATFTTINPATEDVICEVAEANESDVEKAVLVAESAAAEWAELDARERGKVMMAMANAVEKHGEDLAQLDCLDAGKPILDCREDIHASSGLFRYFAGLTDKIHGMTVPVQSDKLFYTRREPYGVIAAITAWNYPMFNASAKIAPIIATGNACILKPAEEAPLTALRLAEILSDVEGVPTGLVNVLNGPGETTGALLTHHRRIRKMTFTGSTATGRELLRAAADSNLKGVTLELGGKAPLVIFEDADLEAALNALTFSVFYNQGQTCTAATRLLVQSTVLDTVLDGLRERLARVVVGDPTNEETSVGPLISRSQYEKALHYIEQGMSAGVKLITGGKRPEGFEKGFYLEPTVFFSPPQESTLTVDEIFGPILVVHEFDDEKQALEFANDTNYGLAASVWTKDAARLHNFAHKLQAGIIWCNTVFAEHPGAPAGGYKESGFGREFGTGAIEEYTQLKSIWIDLSGEHFEWV